MKCKPCHEFRSQQAEENIGIEMCLSSEGGERFTVEEVLVLYQYNVKHLTNCGSNIYIYLQPGIQYWMIGK